MNILASKDNQKIKYVKKIRDDVKERLSSSLFFVEGERNISDIDVSMIAEVYISEGYEGYIPHIDEDKIYRVKDQIFSDIKDTKTTQGIVALVKMRYEPHRYTIKDFFDDIDKDNEAIKDKILILDNIQDPGNLGTILRTSEASGIYNIMLVHDCVDLYNTKVVRASMSSITRLNIYRSYDSMADIKYIKEKGYKIIGTFLDSDKVYTDDIYKDKVAIVIGNEGSGISSEVKDMCDIKISIPMSGEIESLNASVACAIVLYEVKRQYEYVY